MILDLLPQGPAFTVFMVAAFAIGVAPGPGMMFCVARAVSQGQKAGAVSVLGLSTGSFILCVAAALGVAAVLQTSQIAYDILRYMGAAYLVYLAVRTIVVGGGVPETPEKRHRDPLFVVYRQGVVTNILNPKSGLFYVSFVPQFLDPAKGSLLAQFILMGIIFNVMGNLINLAVALSMGRLAEWLGRHPAVWRGQQWLTATILGGIAMHMVLSERN